MVKDFHDGAYDATTADATAGLHVWWRWCELTSSRC